MYEETQDPVELSHERDEHIENDTPLDAGTKDKEWEESMAQSEGDEEVRVQQPELALQDHKGSPLYPLLDFIPLSPYFESINCDPPYILYVIADAFNCCWEMTGDEFLKICLMSKLSESDARNKCRDITFPFDRG